MIERWLVAIRDHPNRPTVTQRMVLHSLALRMDWVTGRGFASVKQLGDDADASDRTARRALTWARDQGFALRTRRGHRISTDVVIASEWRLTQPVTRDQLEEPTGQNGRPNRSIAPAQPVTGAPPSRSVSSRTVISARANGADAPRAGTKPRWCGFCDERTRLFGDPPQRCGKCHPLAQQQTQPAIGNRLDDAEPLGKIIAGVAERQAP